MKKHRLLLPAMSLLLICSAALAIKPSEDANEKPVVIRGLLRDIACPIQNKRSTSRSFNRKCAEECAKRGSPLAILTDDGTMYITISESMPDVDQHQKLMPYIGKYVEASGIVYERNGMHSISIKQIKEDKSVTLKDDLE